jgi:hypothetical protein
MAAAAVAPGGAACAGADPAITTASVKSTTPNGGLDDIRVAVTVRNLGSQKQPLNTLQSVAIYQDATKVGMKGVPPLAPGQSYTFVYDLQRSRSAGTDTTPLRFHLVVKQPAGGDCDASNDDYRLRV